MDANEFVIAWIFYHDLYSMLNKEDKHDQFFFYTGFVEQVVGWQLINEFSDQLDMIVFVRFRYFVSCSNFAHQVFIYNFLATPWMSSWLNCIGIVIVVLGYFDLMGFGSRKRKNISLILFVFSTSFIYLPLIFNKAVMLVCIGLAHFVTISIMVCSSFAIQYKRTGIFLLCSLGSKIELRRNVWGIISWKVGLSNYGQHIKKCKMFYFGIFNQNYGCFTGKIMKSKSNTS